MPVPRQCQALSDEIEALRQERADLQTELRSAATPMKSVLARQIKHLTFLINARTPALDSCIVQFGGPPSAQPLATSFAGMVALTTDRGFPGEPFTAGVNWALLLDAARTHVFITAFAPWVIDTTSAAPPQFGFLFGPNITTVTQQGPAGSGGYAKANGHLGLNLTLHFNHSRDIPFFDEDSDLSMSLTTASPPGSPVTAAGSVVLAGSGAFSGGWLNGVICAMTVTGTLTPIP